MSAQDTLFPEFTLSARERLDNLTGRFIVPPFTVLDARQGYWQERKRAWIGLGIQSELGRGDRLMGDGAHSVYTGESKWAGQRGPRTAGRKYRPGAHGAFTGGFAAIDRAPTAKSGVGLLGISAQAMDYAGGYRSEDGSFKGTSGTSVFDPVLCELAYSWFCPPHGAILDVFAGGSVRGVVAAVLERRYTGIDLRPEQGEANRVQWRNIVHECWGLSRQPVRVWAAMLRQEFHPCTQEFVRTVCGAACCRACPFLVNATGALVVRPEYRALPCFRAAGAEPIYRTQFDALRRLFGDQGAVRIRNTLDAGGGDLQLEMPTELFRRLGGKILAPDILPDALPFAPRWVVGDGRDAKDLAPGEYDFLFTCPPYGDLEIYSDDPRDLSNMTYEEFLAAYRYIIGQSAALLRPDRFAAIVVANFRDRKTGLYRDFVSDTVAAFRDAGLGFYNEAMLVTAIGSLPIRVGAQFRVARKLGKTHQQLLVFVKGDPRRATEAVGEVEHADLMALV